jgi:hypothetical protein
MLIIWLWKYFFIGQEEEYNKETYWRCNYCTHQFKDEGPQEEKKPEEKKKK